MKVSFWRLILILGLSVISMAEGQAESIQELSEKLMHINNAYIAAVKDRSDQKDIADTKKHLDTIDARFVTAVEKIMKDNDIRYEIVRANNETYGEWKYFRILNNGTSGLNALSHQLKKTLDVNMVFDPLLLQYANAKGGYSGKDLTLYVSTPALSAGPEEPTTQHEVLHAHFDGMRRGKILMDTGFPVHIKYRSTSPLDPKRTMPTQYSVNMSFEELVTHSMNINASAQQATEESHADLLREIHRLQEVSSYAKIASEKGLALLANKLEPFLHKDNGTGQTHAYLKEDKSFVIGVFVKEADLQKLDFDVTQYLKLEMEKSLKLAEFNLNYFASVKESSLSSSDVSRAKAFAEAQKNRK